VTVADDLDRLYGVRPEKFTALRKELTTAARKRGDGRAAKEITAARRPTTAAWVVNTLVRTDDTASARLSELTDALRAAHAAMDGPRIRELTATQRKLVSELVRTAFDAAGISEPTGVLRDDVTGTLQAAIADPDVARRLGRLEKAEQWSGFGAFGLSDEVVTTSRRDVRPPQPSKAKKEPDDAAIAAARKRREAAAAEVEVARAAHIEAVDAVDDRKAKVATARRRYEKLLEALNAAESDVDAADAQLDDAKDTLDRAAEQLETAQAELARADTDLHAVGDP
jgi:exonuclease VII small subunit